MSTSRSDALAADLQRLYEEHLGDFRRVATAIAGGAEEGRDAVQEGFAKALASRRSFRGESPLIAWVWRIVINEARNAARARKRALPALSTRQSDYGSDTRDVLVREALEQLPERERLAVFLRYFADLEYTTIAKSLEISVGTVGASLSAGRAKLGRLLEGCLS